MSKKKPRTLKKFVYRSLALRLLVMALVAGLLAATLVYFSERQRLRAQVIAAARTEIKFLVASTARLIKEEQLSPINAFHRALDERVEVTLRPKIGLFVYADFFHQGNTELEEFIANTYPLKSQVAAFALANRPKVPVQNEDVRLVSIAGQLHVTVLMPLVDTKEPNSPYVQAIFAPSQETLKAMRLKLLRSVLLALLVVAGTSLILYPILLTLFSKLTQFSQNLLDAQLASLDVLASAIAKRDNNTDVHNFRVTLYAVRLAQSCQLQSSSMQGMIKGAFLHDVGKIGIRDDILLKPGKLNEEEIALMHEHVRFGLEIIAGSPWLTDAADVVGGHHEKFDGTGYPQGTVGESIPLTARIFAILDVFDALTSKRPYKQPFSYEKTMQILEESRGSHFDPHILDAFLTIAPDLYKKYAGRDDEGLREEFRHLMTQHFSRGEIVL